MLCQSVRLCGVLLPRIGAFGSKPAGGSRLAQHTTISNKGQQYSNLNTHVSIERS